MKNILKDKEIGVILNRLSCQLIENYKDFKDTVLVGIQPRGSFMARRISQILQQKYGKKVPLGFLDITFFRDDFKRGDKILLANTTDIEFIVEGKNVIFIDDVLYTGRSVTAALSAIQSFGRPKKIELMVLIDRRFSRELPIEPDYCGKKVDSLDNERVIVSWRENSPEDSVVLYKN